MSEKFNAYEQLIAFFYNSDSECRKSHGLQEDKEYLAFFNGEDLPPKYLEVPEDGIPEKNLLYETAVVRSVYGRPIWGTRAK